MISLILISRIGKPNNGDRNHNRVCGRGPKRVLCHVHFLHIDSGVDYPKVFTSERLNSILRSVHFTFSTFTSLKKKAIGMRLLKYIGKSNIS